MLRYTKILLILLIGGCIYGSSISSLGYRSRTNIESNTSGRRSGNIERTVSGEGHGTKKERLVNKGDIGPTQKGTQKHLDSRDINRPSNRDNLSNGKYTTFLVTAYTKNDKGMNGKGITASGKKASHMVTVASRGLKMGTRIYLVELDKIVVVEDRFGVHKASNRLDLYIGTSKEDALKFGKRKLKGVILK